MGRITEYIDFINRKPMPSEERIQFLYTHLKIDEKMKLLRKEHQKNLKRKEKFKKIWELF